MSRNKDTQAKIVDHRNQHSKVQYPVVIRRNRGSEDQPGREGVRHQNMKTLCGP